MSDLPAASPSLVGRDAELERLRELVRAARKGDGRGRAALVTGPAGVGKSRLMSELKRELRESRETVFEGACHTSDHRPYAPLVELVAGAVTLLSDLGHPAPCGERALSLIAGLPSPGDLPRGELARAEDLKLHFYETVRHALIELARVRRPVIYLHDLHRADAATLGLLCYLLENLVADPAFDWAPNAGETLETIDITNDDRPTAPGFRGLIVLSFRAVPETEPLLEVARTSDAVAHLQLSGLDADGVRSFLQTPSVVERMLKASGGLPIALEQLLDSLPDDATGLWGRRLADLDPATAPVLEALSTFARPGAPAELAGLVAGTPELGELLTRLNELVRQRVLVRTLRHGHIRFRFVGTGAREAYYRRIPEARRIEIHRRIAVRLAALVGVGAEPEEVAHHYLEAGDQAAAVPYALAAADQLHAAFAYGRAAKLLERVVNGAEGAARADVLDRLGELYALTGATEQARNALETLMATPAPSPQHERRGLARRLARLHMVSGDRTRALEIIDHALAEPPQQEELWWLRALAAECAYGASTMQEAAERCRDCDRAPDGPAQLSIRNTLGKVYLAQEALDDAYDLFAQNLAAARALDEPGYEAGALINLGIVHLQRGEPDAAAGRFEAARRRAESIGDLRRLALSLENLAVLHHRRQDFATALSLYHQSTSAFRKLGHHAQLATTSLNLAELYVTVGEHERAKRLVEIARDHSERGRSEFADAHILRIEGAIARAEGETDTAAERYGAAISKVETVGGLQRLGRLFLELAEVHFERGDFDAASAWLERATQLQTSTAGEAIGAPSRALRGAIRAARGETEPGIEELEAAVNELEGGGDREALWRALHQLAEARWGHGNRGGTVQALAGAVECFEAIAARLPETLRTPYLAHRDRRRVHDALRRVRIGASLHRTDDDDDATSADRRTMRRQSTHYRAIWARRYPQFIGRDTPLHAVFNTLDRVAGSDSMVLLRGESGTGKELVAAALHANSPRTKGPFVKVNCAAFVETLLLSELFGHEKGAFTGALARKKGRFELAHRGTLFLDEIGDISPNTQVALLRVLQEKIFERVGGSDSLEVDVRVICATHRNLEEMVRRGGFRADLYYRLRGVILELPALRDRKPDIPLLVDHFLARRARAGERPLRFTREAMASLIQHDWPGNVRELENVVRSVALFADGDEIGLTELAELGDIFRPPSEDALLELNQLDGVEPPRPDDLGSPKPRGRVVSAPIRIGERDDADEQDHDDSDDCDTDIATANRVRPVNQPTPGVADGPPTDSHSELNGAWLERMLEASGGLTELKKRIEFEAISNALLATNGNITRAAERLGMKRPRLSQIIHASSHLGELKRAVSGS